MKKNNIIFEDLLDDVSPMSHNHFDEDVYKDFVTTEIDFSDYDLLFVLHVVNHKENLESETLVREIAFKIRQMLSASNIVSDFSDVYVPENEYNIKDERINISVGINFNECSYKSAIKFVLTILKIFKSKKDIKMSEWFYQGSTSYDYGFNKYIVVRYIDNGDFDKFSAVEECCDFWFLCEQIAKKRCYLDFINELREVQNSSFMRNFIRVFNAY